MAGVVDDDRPHGGPKHRSNVILVTLLCSRPGRPVWENAWANATPADRVAYLAALEARQAVLERERREMIDRWPELGDA